MLWRKKRETPTVVVDTNNPQIAPYYFSVEASEYREKIAELERQIYTEREARHVAEQAMGVRINEAFEWEQAKRAFKTIGRLLDNNKP